MPGDALAEYIQNGFKKLARRKSYVRKWGPTNDQLKTIIETLVNNDTPLIRTFSYHGVDLVNVASATFWGIRRESQIQAKATELRTLKAAEHKSRQRAKQATEQDIERTLPPKVLKRFLAGFSRRQDIVHGEEQLSRLTTSHPNFPHAKRNPTTGRRQTFPVKIAHMELARFFARKYRDVEASQRHGWICRILNASGLYQYSGETFQKRTSRLRKQISSPPARS